MITAFQSIQGLASEHMPYVGYHGCYVQADKSFRSESFCTALVQLLRHTLCFFSWSQVPDELQEAVSTALLRVLDEQELGRRFMRVYYKLLRQQKARGRDAVMTWFKMLASASQKW